MTKMKSKKMAKSTFAIIIMAIVMVAMLAFGGTYAYFTAKSSALGGSVTTGTLTITENTGAKITISDKLVPNKVLKVVDTTKVEFKGTTISAYRINLSIDKITRGTATDDIKDSFDNLSSMLLIDIADKFEAGAVSKIDTTTTADAVGTDAAWLKDGSTYYYNTVKAPTANGFALSTIAPVVTIKLDALANNDYQDLTITYTLSIEAAQAEFVGSSYAAGVTDGQILSLNALKGLTSWTYATQNNAPVVNP